MPKCDPAFRFVGYDLSFQSFVLCSSRRVIKHALLDTTIFRFSLSAGSYGLMSSPVPGRPVPFKISVPAPAGREASSSSEVSFSPYVM